MTDYNDGKWHGWNGGKCPVHLCTKVKVAFDTCAPRSGPARLYDWAHRDARENIIAFRVIKEHREPKVGWVRPECIRFDEPDDSEIANFLCVREVLSE